MRLLLSLLASAPFVLSQAATPAPACSGSSMLETFQRENPALYQEAVEEFAATPNGYGLFWRVEKAGLAPSWLFGTMHVADPQITSLREPVAAAFAQADTLVVESIEVLDPDFTTELAAEMMAMAELPEGETFDAAFSEEEKEALGEMTAAHGIPYFMARRMKPWFISVLLSLPPCVAIGTLQGEPVLDQRLFLDATADGKEIVGLESADEQLAALASLDAAMDETALLEIIAMGLDGIEDWYATLVELYVEERVAFLVPLLDKSRELAAMASAMEDAEADLVVKRNLRMHERVLPVLETGNVFVGVGALHLSGEMGLIELLRESGFVVTRIQ